MEKKRHRLALIHRLMSHLKVTKPLTKLSPSKWVGTVRIYDVVRMCPGGRHAWVESNVGVIRKPLGFSIRR